MVSSSGSTSSYKPIVFSGLASGIDSASSIQQMLDARKSAITSVESRVSAQQTKADAIKDVKSRLTNLFTHAKNLTDFSALQGKSANVSAGGSSATVSVSAGSTATSTSFKVTVLGLADSTRVSSPTALGSAIDPAALLKNTNLATKVTAGSFTINGVSIAVDPAVDSLNDVMARIQTNVAGATVTLENDASGRANALKIAVAGGVTLGAGGDTSNFLSATKLLASAPGAARTSTSGLGVVQASTTLSAALPAIDSTGSFKVNGVQIHYDGSKDSLNGILTRITNSTAGVTATYDSITDKLTLVNKKTGSTAIALEDLGGGDFLSGIRVRGATQTTGKNAHIQVDSGNGAVDYYSTSNTVADALPGVTFTLLKESATADTVTVAQDINGALAKAKEFISQFNSTLEFINVKTATDITGAGKSGPFAGDSTITSIATTLRRLVTDRIDGATTGSKQSLADVGITFGAVGSKPGETKTLKVDDAKFKAAMEADPAGVANLFSAFRATASLNGGGAGNVASVSGDPTSIRVPGRYTFTTEVNGDGTANITAVFKPRDGGTGTSTTLANVAAGSTNDSLIAGVKLTFGAAFTASTDTLTIATPTRGVASKLEQYLDTLARSGGTMDQRKDTADKGVKDLKAQVQRMNDRLDEESERLQRKFAAMEVAIQKMAEQRSALSSLALAVQNGGYSY